MPDLLDEEDLMDSGDAADTPDVPAMPLPAAAAPAPAVAQPGALPDKWWIAPPKPPEIDRTRVNAIRDLYNAVPPGEAGKAIEMATRLEGILGFDADVKSGVPFMDALRTWAPKLYFNHPGAVSRLVQPPFSPSQMQVGGQNLIQTSPNRYQVIPPPIGSGPITAQPVLTPGGMPLPGVNAIHGRGGSVHVIPEKSQGPTATQLGLLIKHQLDDINLQMRDVTEGSPEEIALKAKAQELRGHLDRVTKSALHLNAPPQTADIPKVTTQAQYNALPHGAVYVSKNGKKHRKP
jgi:hypothetical protein